MRKEYKRLTWQDRLLIEQMFKSGKKIKEVAEEIGIHKDTIYKELKRSNQTPETYRAEIAQQTL